MQKYLKFSNDNLYLKIITSCKFLFNLQVNGKFWILGLLNFSDLYYKEGGGESFGNLYYRKSFFNLFYSTISKCNWDWIKCNYLVLMN